MSDAEEEIDVYSGWIASPEQIHWKDNSFTARYNHHLDVFFNFLVELNTDIYIIERILAFPVDLFSGGHAEGDIFFSRIIANFADNAILMITKLVKDDGTSEARAVYNLRHFKNDIIRALKDEYKELFFQQFKAVDFEKRTDALLQKAKMIRDHRIAHHAPGIFQANFGQTTQQVQLLFQEMKELRDALNEYYEALTFGAECFMLPLSYQDNTSDVDEVLDSYAKNSAILNMPELDPEKWKYQRERLTDEAKAHLNRYRKKFGLSEI